MQLVLQAANDVVRARSLGERLQIDLNAAAIHDGVDAVNSDKGGKAFDRGILLDDARPALCCKRDISAKETLGGASETPKMTPVSCTGKKPLGTMMKRKMVTAKRSGRDKKRDGLVAQHHLERVGIFRE